MAVAPGGGVARAPSGSTVCFGLVARNEPHAELAQYAVAIEDGGAVDLGESVTQRGEMRQEYGSATVVGSAAAPRRPDRDRRRVGR